MFYAEMRASFDKCDLQIFRMLHEDRVVFALLLSRIYLKGLKQDSSLEDEFQHLLRGNQVRYSSLCWERCCRKIPP